MLIAEKHRITMRARLARIEGQVRGLQRMMAEDDANCEKVAQQMLAARKALDKAAHTMLACMVQQHIEQGKAADMPDIETLISKYA